jgi:hypothetical protein
MAGDFLGQSKRTESPGEQASRRRIDSTYKQEKMYKQKETYKQEETSLQMLHMLGLSRIQTLTQS